MRLTLLSFRITAKLIGFLLIRPGFLLKSTCWNIFKKKEKKAWSQKRQKNRARPDEILIIVLRFNIFPDIVRISILKVQQEIFSEINGPRYHAKSTSNPHQSQKTVRFWHVNHGRLLVPPRCALTPTQERIHPQCSSRRPWQEASPCYATFSGKRPFFTP